MKHYFEIITNDNRRPDYPEDNTVILCASDMANALDKYKDLRDKGKLHVSQDINTIRKIKYVFDEK